MNRPNCGKGGIEERTLRKTYRRALKTRISGSLLFLFCALIAPIAATLGLSKLPAGSFADLFPGLAVGLTVMAFCLYLSARMLLWGYVVTEKEVQVVGLISTTSHQLEHIAGFERFEKWSAEHNPPCSLFGGYIVRDFIHGEMFRIVEIDNIEDLKHEMECGINLSQRPRSSS
jgi:hypothetical protein